MIPKMQREILSVVLEGPAMLDVIAKQIDDDMPNTARWVECCRCRGWVRTERWRPYGAKSNVTRVTITSEGRSIITGEPTAVEMMIEAWKRIKPCREAA